MKNITQRPYMPSDFAACLALFDSNVPVFFAPREREEFCQFLEFANTENRPYLVLLAGDTVVACGGLYLEPEKQQASLAWGMVDRAHHGQRLGTLLTQARLTMARNIPFVSELTLATSQHTHGFYEGFGFTVLKVTPNGFSEGLDQWDMVLKLGQ